MLPGAAAARSCCPAPPVRSSSWQRLDRAHARAAAMRDASRDWDSDSLLQLLRERQQQALAAGTAPAAPTGPGAVYLVGTGPGDPGLLTLRAVQLMQSADVVLYDRLVSDDVLRLVHGGARMVYVGKEAGYHTRTQAEIHELLLQFAEAGATVLRLKGGDPYVFGRCVLSQSHDSGSSTGSAPVSVCASHPHQRPCLCVYVCIHGMLVPEATGLTRSHAPICCCAAVPCALRGGEEVQYLQAAGVTVRCVPGITAASGICAGARLSVRHIVRCRRIERCTNRWVQYQEKKEESTTITSYVQRGKMIV